MPIEDLKKKVQAGGSSQSYIPSGVVHVDTTAVGTDANTAEKDLITYSLPANSLSANGKMVRFKAWGTTAANANTKRIKLYFGSTAIIESGAVSANNSSWTIYGTVVRTGVGTQDSFDGGFAYKAVSGTAGRDFGEFYALTEDETGAITLKVTGQNGAASASDIVAEGIMVEFLN